MELTPEEIEKIAEDLQAKWNKDGEYPDNALVEFGNVIIQALLKKITFTDEKFVEIISHVIAYAYTQGFDRDDFNSDTQAEEIVKDKLSPYLSTLKEQARKEERERIKSVITKVNFAPYKEFRAEIGERPKDICFSMGQVRMRELILQALNQEK